MGNDASQGLPVAGVRLAAGAAGIRYPDRNDLALVALDAGSTCAALFTRNAFCAAPVTLARRHLAATAPRWWLINSGNANAGTGEAGRAAAQASCDALAALSGCNPSEVLPFSTGVIGEPLPVEPIAAALPGLLATLHPDGWSDAARAIMTTDTVPKLVSRRLRCAGVEATITGIAKGSGMIRPDMATMLAFIATDLAVDQGLLQASLRDAVDRSFNAVTVDGDTSTNDACVLAATGALGNVPLGEAGSAGHDAFQEALDALCLELATAIVRDGEGATKLVRIRVEEAVDQAEARRVAYTIAHSPLVKTALFASDPNWGRILAAVGRSGLEGLAIEGVRIWLDGVRIVSAGGRDPGYTEEAGAAVMRRSDILIRVALGRGPAQTQVLTCDLSYDYVRINAEYRT